MSKKAKRARRAEFRRAVFARAKYRCEVCSKPGHDRQGGDDHRRFHEGTTSPLDAHHITNRNDIPNGGYVAENGIALCDECHHLAETESPGFEPTRLYDVIGSSLDEAIEAARRL